MKNIDEQIAKTQDQIKQLTNKKKAAHTGGAKQAERKKRTRRLIERDVISEIVIDDTKDFSNE